MSEIIIQTPKMVLTRVGNTENGRQKYETVTNEKNGESYKSSFSVAEKDVDKFEKIYKDNQEFLSEFDNEQNNKIMDSQKEKVNKTLKNTTIISTITGTITPAALVGFLMKGSALKKTLIGIPLTLIGTIGGFIGGTMLGGYIAVKKHIPGTAQAMNIANKIRKLDIQPISNEKVDTTA